MDTYPNLIADICRTEKTIKNVSISIPILIRWAKSGITTNTYGDLIKEMGMNRYSGIGHVLGKVEDVIKSLREKTGQAIPTLNALVNGKDGLPSQGFNYVYPEYDNYPFKVKKALTENENNKAVLYEQWDQVLQALCLKPSVVNSEKDEALIRGGKHFGRGGEGPQHKSLKEYIFAHPESLGLRNVVGKKTEHILLSGDRLDVYFEQKDGTKIAVEVKPIISTDDDILRGLYQCVKYKAVLDAEGRTHGLFGNNRSLLVLEGVLSRSNQQVKDSLGITVIEGFLKKD